MASGDESGGAYLVPLSFHWDGSTLTVATPRASRTARNLVRAGWARVALGPTDGKWLAQDGLRLDFAPAKFETDVTSRIAVSRLTL